jgi:hypothetical protein
VREDQPLSVVGLDRPTIERHKRPTSPCQPSKPRISS